MRLPPRSAQLQNLRVGFPIFRGKEKYAYSVRPSLTRRVSICRVLLAVRSRSPSLKCSGFHFPRKREIRVFSASLAYASGFHLSRKSNIAQRQNAQARVSDACLTSHPEPCSMETRPRQRGRATHAQHLAPSPAQWKPERASEGERRMLNISPRTPLNGNPNASARASDACLTSRPEPHSMETRTRQRGRATYAQYLSPNPAQWKSERVSEGERRMPHISP